MTRKSSNEISSDAYLGWLTTLLANGYNDEVKAFTSSIQSNQDAVLDFEIAFDMLNFDAIINWVGTPSQEASMTLVDTRLDEMNRFLARINRPYESYVSVTNHGLEATIEIGWLDQMTDFVVWERLTYCVDDPVMAFADIGFMFDIKNYQCAPKLADKPEPPLYRYHPERFKAYRDYSEPVGKHYRQKVQTLPD